MSSLNLRFAIASLWATFIATLLLVWTLVETRETSRREIQSGFTNQGVEKALDSFLATNRYLEIKSAAKSHGSAAPKGPDSPSETIQKEETIMPANAIMARPEVGTTHVFQGGELDFSLTKKGLSLTGTTKRKAELLAFAEQLKALAALLPDDGAESDDD